MAEMQELYQEVLLDHYKRPRNYYKLTDANRTVEGYNPLCGDHIFVYLRLENNKIKDVSFEGSGCAISKASASLMTESVKGKSVEEAEALFEKFHDMVTTEPGKDVSTEALGKLAIFIGVREYPSRVKCAILSWHTLKAGLSQNQASGSVSTE